MLDDGWVPLYLLEFLLRPENPGSGDSSVATFST